MTTLDDKLLPAVKSMAAKLGKDVTVTVEALTYVPATGTSSRTPTTHANQKLLGLRPVSQRYFDLGLAQEGDSQAMFAASGLSFTPALGVRVAIGGTTYTTTMVEEIHSGASIAAYRVLLRTA
jgi:hypothetical protein